VSGYTTQLSKHVAVLKELVRLVKTGQYTKSIGTPSKLVLMGFSLGSYITHAAIGATPDLADAVILTAIGLVRSFVPRIASDQDPKKFRSFDNGYLTWVDKWAQANTYFKKPYYDVATLDFAESAKQPFGIAEFLTILAGNQGSFDASGFEGAALVTSSSPQPLALSRWPSYTLLSSCSNA
jgi:pimeloyl-ACP methyl ester carboxylesterase